VAGAPRWVVEQTWRGWPLCRLAVRYEQRTVPHLKDITLYFAQQSHDCASSLAPEYAELNYCVRGTAPDWGVRDRRA
jgi:hypothetical protein